MYNFSKPVILSLVLITFGAVVFTPVDAATYYVDSTNGDDTNSGLAPENAWKTISKINDMEFQPGDFILFKRGEIWRNHLIIQSNGNETSSITFSDYGSGDKPLILGSTERSRVDDWRNEDDNRWVTLDPGDGYELLQNPSFNENLADWKFSVNGNANADSYHDTMVYDSSPAGLRIECIQNAESSPDSSISLKTTGFHISENEWYILSFRAKTSSNFTLHTPNLLKTDTGRPYYSERSRHNLPITTDWKTYNSYYYIDETASDGEVNIYLGNMPNESTLYLDTFSFQKCNKIPLASDVGALIFNNEESVGVKENSEIALDEQGEFWYDPGNGRVKIYSSTNPGEYYENIECTLGSYTSDSPVHTGPIISIHGNHVTVENLDLRYGGADGVWVQDVGGTIIKNCDITYCGGTYQETDDTVRMGNGVTFWENTWNSKVEGCRIGEIYDAALSNQGDKTNTQSNLLYQNNIIWNSEYSFELWDRPQDSLMKDIRFINNTCIGAGFGWGHEQRPDLNGYHINMKSSQARADGIYIKNNVLYQAANSSFFFLDEYWVNGQRRDAWVNLENFEMDNNYYYQSSGFMVVYPNDKNKYTMAEFQEYQDTTGLDTHSVTGNKTYVQNVALSRGNTSLINELLIQADNEASKYFTVPIAPQNLRAVGETGYILLTWNQSRTDGGSPITGYRIYRGKSPDNLNHLTDTSNVITYNDTDVEDGQIYYYQISALNDIGESSLSNRGHSSSIAAPPKPPVEENDEKDSGIPGFPLNSLLLAIIFVVYLRKNIEQP